MLYLVCVSRLLKITKIPVKFMFVLDIYPKFSVMLLKERTLKGTIIN